MILIMIMIILVYKVVVTCEIKLFLNNFEIISAFYFTRNHRQWLHVKKHTEIISRLFQCLISHVTTPEIISKLFQPLKSFQNNFRGLLQLMNIFQHVQCR